MGEGEKKQMQDPVAQLLASVDPELLSFLRSQVNSFVKWDLAHFFHENPHTTDTAPNIARYVGRNAEIVEAELEDLVEGSILVARRLAGVTTYALSPDQAVRERIRRFVEACNDREFRLKAIYHIIRGLR